MRDMAVAALLTWLVVGLGLAGGLAFFGRPPAGKSGGAVRLWMVGGAIYGLAAWLDSFQWISRNLGDVWSAPRLAISFALSQGLPIYYSPGEGPLLCNLYGPVLALAYLPATLFGKVEAALFAGGALAMGWVFLGVAAGAGAGLDRARSRWAAACLGAVLFHFFLSLDPILKAPVYFIHADAPAIGLGLLACGLAFRGGAGWTVGRMLVVSLLVALSIWTKLLMLPLLVVLPAWVVWTGGRRIGLRFGLVQGLVMALVSIAFLLGFGPHRLWFSMVTIHAGSPWYGGLWEAAPNLYPMDGDWAGRIRVLTQAGAELMGHCLPVGLVLGGTVALSLARDRVRGGLPSPTLWAQRNPWILLVIVAVSLAPMSMLGRVKVGGDTNAYAYTGVFLTAGLAVFLARILLRGVRQPVRERSDKLRYRVVVWLVLLAAMVRLSQAIADVRRTLPQMVSPSTAAIEYARRHPGTAWFAWNPLVAVMAENRVDHFDYNLLTHEEAGYGLDTEQLEAWLPPDLEYIVNLHSLPFHSVSNYFPGMHRVDPPAGMPDHWTVYVPRDPGLPR